MVDNGDVRLQLDDLEAEEARIMRELREMDEKAEAEKAASSRRADQIREDPEAALSSLLLECEKEVRDAKGFIADQGPPLKIVRLKHGETGPRSATYLSRPRNTGVDFTVPVTLKAYTDLIKHPIFLNQIREKIKSRKYRSTEDYLNDMRLLVRNTAQFNKGPDLAWVVQHAKFLLEAAEDAIQSRRLAFHQIEQQLQHHAPSKPSRATQGALTAVGKRKRPQNAEKTNGDVASIPPVGSSIEIYWHPYRKWYVAYITDRDGSSVNVRYQEDNSEQVVDLNRERWRMRSSRTTTRSKRVTEPTSKRRKGGAATPTAQNEPALTTSGLTHEDLDSIKIDLFAKFEDLRDSVNEQLKQHLDRVDRAILRSDALTRILVQLGDTQNSVETAITTIFDKFEKLERRFESALQSQQQNLWQREARDVKMSESRERNDGRKEEDSKVRLDNDAETEDAKKNEANHAETEDAKKNEANPSHAEGQIALNSSIKDSKEKGTTDTLTEGKQLKSTELKTTTTTILISDDENPEDINKAKAHVSQGEKPDVPRNDEDPVESAEVVAKGDQASTEPNQDRESDGGNDDVMDVDEVPNTGGKASPLKPKAEKSPVVRTVRKIVSADTGMTSVAAKTVDIERDAEVKAAEGSVQDCSSNSSSRSEESDESESDQEKRDTLDPKPKTALKEPRKSKPSRFANRVDIEKPKDGAESSHPEEDKKEGTQTNQSNGVSEGDDVQKDKKEQSGLAEAEGSTNLVQNVELVAKDKDEVKSGDT